MPKLAKTLWVSFVVYSDGTEVEGYQNPGRSAAYPTRGGAKNMCRHRQFKTLVHEDDELLVYQGSDYPSKRPIWCFLVRQEVSVDLAKIRSFLP